MRVSKSNMLRRIFGHKREDAMEAGKNCAVRSFIIGSPCQLVWEWAVLEDEISAACGRMG